jgi:hypothetical protein
MKAVVVPGIVFGIGVAIFGSACSSAGDPVGVTPGAGVPAAEPDAEPGTDPAEGESAPGAEACQLTAPWGGPISATCSAQAGACLAKTQTSVGMQICIRDDAKCSSCFSEVVAKCLVGSPAKPGVCGAAAGCVQSCLARVCGAGSAQNCTEQAMRTGACADVTRTMEACFDKADQRPCMSRFRDVCIPKPSCGNGVIEAGETCDKDCPTSCPSVPAGDQCTIRSSKGSASTCSAACETESRCPAQCPSNVVPVSNSGIIASGTTLPGAQGGPATVAWPSLASLQSHGCPSSLEPTSHVISWRAPISGRYSFSSTCRVSWRETSQRTGDVSSRYLDCFQRIGVVRGKQCTPGALGVDCGFNPYGDNRVRPDKLVPTPLDLLAGDEVLVAVNFLLGAIPPSATDVYHRGYIDSNNWSVSATACVPICNGKTCGSDGCGGTCGACVATQTCSAAGKCEAACVPQCAGKSCGSNGCGGTCGACAAGQSCDGGGQCKAACIPQCAGKTCGSDGCGGSCGACGGRATCNAGRCQLAGACDPVSDSGCAAPNQCITLANESTQCALMGAGTRGSACADSAGCAGGYACFAGRCRKVCDRASGDGCRGGENCAAVVNWRNLGTCAP